ncbi:hypothetical protein [Agaribacterium sp. ZY112]|uniref:hypothetical protein n=1 Tax=Agaribacterium sp. ZY112 TaxID=3233574 RepID=UPI003523A39A
MDVRYAWPFNQSQIRVHDTHTEAYARWCFNQLSDSATKILRDTSWVFYIKNQSWLEPGLAQMFAYHLEPMIPRMHIAILRGKLEAELPRPGHVADQSKVIGAAICELIEKGKLNGSHLLDRVEASKHGEPDSQQARGAYWSSW